jgi:predicted transglutaminase-like cysteine proteinase
MCQFILFYKYTIFVLFFLDENQYQKEEFWAYPSLGLGDCEDIALEKRFRLVNMGIYRGALRNMDIQTIIDDHDFYINGSGRR